MADWIFDGPNKIITEPAGSGDTTFNVDQEIYSAWKRWVATEVGARFDAAFSVEGGTPIGATGLFTGTTFILINGWKLRAASHDHQVTLIGNIYSDDGIVSVSTPGFSTNIFVSGTVGAQGISTGSGVLPTDVTTIKNAIFDEVLEGTETFRQLMYLVRALAAGDIVQQSDGSYVIKSKDGLIDRITGQLDSNNGRDITATDVS